MLPAIAASITIRIGTPMAAITAKDRLRASASRPAPSVWIIHELAMRLRIGTSTAVPIEPEKVDITKVAAAITNQVFSSWLLTTSPRSSAWSRRFCVGSSVLSSESSSSAIGQALLTAASSRE